MDILPTIMEESTPLEDETPVSLSEDSNMTLPQQLNSSDEDGHPVSKKVSAFSNSISNLHISCY